MHSPTCTGLLTNSVLILRSWSLSFFKDKDHPSHPSSLSQSIGFELHASYSKFLLAGSFTYDNVYVSLLVSQLRGGREVQEEGDTCIPGWCWEGLGAGGEGDDRGWDGWMASLTRWTWVWVNSGSWWWTGRPGVLWFMGLQRVGHDWATELNWQSLVVCMSRCSSQGRKSSAVLVASTFLLYRWPWTLPACTTPRVSLRVPNFCGSTGTKAVTEPHPGFVLDTVIQKIWMLTLSLLSYPNLIKVY